MQLYLDSFGAFLGVRNGQFLVRTGTQRQEHHFPVREVNVIFLTKGTTHTTDALILALNNDIPVVLLDNIGHPIGQVWSGKFGSIATIRRNQILFAADTEGWSWLAQHLRRKLDNQNLVLHQFSPQFNQDANALRRLGKATSTIQGLSNNFDRWQPTTNTPDSQIANTFRAWEATASRYYFRFLASVVPPQYQFDNRNFRPALDKFNALLNYLYGMLYAYVELALMKSGIDPSIGILHVDRYNRPTMVYDFIEPYRMWADTVALQLIFNGQLPDDAFMENPEFLKDSEADPETQGIWLGKTGKQIVVPAFLNYMEEKVTYKHNQQKRSVLLDLEAQTLATLLKKFSIKN
jgi:CRISP-associated protein Cas1